MLFLVRGRLRTSTAGPFSLALLLNSLWALGYALELLAPSFDDKLLLFQIRCSFLCFYAPAWLETVHRMTQGRALLRGWTLAGVLIVPVVSLLLVWFPGPGQNPLLRHSFHVDETGPLAVLRNGLGPWGLVYYGYTYVMWTTSFVLVAPRKHQTPREWRGRLLFLAAGLIGCGADIAHHFGLTTPAGLNYTPILFPLTSTLMALALLRHRMLDLAPVARAALIEQLEDRIVVLDDENRVVDYNQAAATTLGFPPGRTLGRSIGELLTGWPDLAAIPARLENQRTEVSRGMETFEVSLFGVNSSGDHRTHARIMVLRDISRRKETERQLRLAKDAAEAAGNAQSRFLATMSHEIRTPMNGVVGFTQLLKDTSLTTEQRDYLNLIDQSSRSLLVIINDVLDYSKIAADQLEIEQVPCDITMIVDHATRLLVPVAHEKNISLHTRIASDVPAVVISDPVRLNQILTNLLGNAVKFTETGGVTLDVERPGPDLLVFKVADTGIGIAEDQQPRIFTPFNQADASTTRRFGGTGLGLSISRRLCELMNGSLTFSSKPGKGSVFTAAVRVRLSSPAVAAPPHATASASSPTPSLRLLVCEDNPVNQAVIRAFLLRLGHHPRLVGDGAQALALLEREPFDAILMDLEMPVMDGYETVVRIRSSTTVNPRIHIIALTAHALKGERERCLALGMDDFLTKPLNLPALTEALAGIPTRRNTPA
ncbi:MAG: hypothetical protein K0R17_2851 [Rariglobus sp.]|nr:hypothetical protein [Rariglobus sp.]